MPRFLNPQAVHHIEVKLDGYLDAMNDNPDLYDMTLYDALSNARWGTTPFARCVTPGTGT